MATVCPILIRPALGVWQALIQFRRQRILTWLHPQVLPSWAIHILGVEQRAIALTQYHLLDANQADQADLQRFSIV